MARQDANTGGGSFRDTSSVFLIPQAIWYGRITEICFKIHFVI